MVNNIDTAAKLIARMSALSRDEPIHGEIGTVVETDKNGVKLIRSAVSDTNSLSYCPGISSAVGVFRITSYLIDSIMDVGRLLTLQVSPLNGIKNICWNVVQIGRGVVELIPFIGNLTVYVIDKIRIKIIESQINQKEMGLEKRDYYVNGRVVSQGSISSSYKDDFSFMAQAGARFC